jgi:iron complex transport system substrate-binding protein
LAVAVAAIELRREAINLSPQAQQWTPARDERYPRILKDSSGDTVIMTTPPQRIASETLGSDEVVFGVCAGDRVVGVSSVALDDRYSNIAEQAKARSLPTLETVEQTVELQPDLVFVASYSSAEKVELLRSTGIAVFRLSDFDHINDIIGNIRTVGYAVGEDRCAANLANGIEKRLAAIASETARYSSRPRAILYDSSGYTAGTGTLIDEMLHRIGARNVAAEHGIHGSTRISAEAISLWQPDFIIAGAAHGEFDRVRQALLSDPAIANSPAGRSGGIIIIDDRFLLCVSQYFVPAMEGMAEGLYALPANTNTKS